MALELDTPFAQGLTTMVPLLTNEPEQRITVPEGTVRVVPL